MHYTLEARKFYETTGKKFLKLVKLYSAAAIKLAPLELVLKYEIYQNIRIYVDICDFVYISEASERYYFEFFFSAALSLRRTYCD